MSLISGSPEEENVPHTIAERVPDVISKEALEAKLYAVGERNAHEEIDSKMDRILNKNKYRIFRALEDCINELEDEEEYHNFRTAFLDCVDVALKSAPTKLKQIAKIAKRPGRISRFRFNWLYLTRIEVPCTSIKQLNYKYIEYLRAAQLPLKSADAVRFDRMCQRIMIANKSLTSQYKRFIDNVASIDWRH